MDSFVEDPAFSSGYDIEVVISDNASTDHTSDVMRIYTDRFPHHIRYVRGEPVVADLNFERVLRMGSGKFLKLQHDSFGILPGALGPLLKIIRSLEQTRPVLFMDNRMSQCDTETLRHVNSVDDFMEAVSFHCTWIGGFGIWREDLDALPDFSRAYNLRLVQFDALLRMVAAKKSAVVLREFIQPCFSVGVKEGGYNVAEVFGANYLKILKGHVLRNDLSHENFSREKRKVLFEHIFPFILNGRFNFRHDNLIVHLRDYIGEDYFEDAVRSIVNQLESKVARAPA